MSNVESRLNGIYQNGYNFNLGDYISKGFDIFKNNAGLFIGYLIVYYLIHFILGLLPFIGQLGTLLISTPLTLGFYIVAHKTYNREEVSFSNFFDGFTEWAQLLVAGLLSFLIVMIAFVPAIIFLLITLGTAFLQDAEDIGSGYNPFLYLGFANLMIVFLLFMVAAMVAMLFFYAPLFVYFEKLTAWNAIVLSAKVVSKQFFMHILFGIVWFIIIIISAIPLGLGLLVTIPASLCSVYIAWRSITNYQQNAEADEDELMRHLID